MKLISIGNVDVWMSYCDLAFDAFFRGRILDAISVIGRKLGDRLLRLHEGNSILKRHGTSDGSFSFVCIVC